MEAAVARMWLLWALCACCLTVPVLGLPQFLPCGPDNGTKLRSGETIMGQPVGAFGSSTLNITVLHQDGRKVDQFTPGEVLTLKLDGLPNRAFFAVRAHDGSGQVSGTQPRVLTNKCPEQVYAAFRAETGRSEFALLTTPCNNAPGLVAVSLAASHSGRGPFYYISTGVRRGTGRASSCGRTPPPAPPLYPFQEPLNSTCPNGAAAQHDAPCPEVPCVPPEGKNGTCLVTPDQTQPLQTGSINAEARVELLTDDVTPITHHYVTGSAPPPRAWSRDLRGWSLLIDGEVDTPRNFTLADLQAFPHVTRRYVLECAGNWGRGMLPADQQADWWSIGAIGCSEWTGVLLRDVLHSLGVKPSAVYVGYYGEDHFLSRGVPIEKALDGYTMLAWEMNGVPLPAHHGFPLRLLAPGYPGSAQGKWLKRLWVRDREHDGVGMLGKSYRVPMYPIRAGDYTAPDKWFKVFTQQPVRSLIVRPPRCTVTHDQRVTFQGKAWSGAGDVVKVELSYDAGLSWLPARLSPPANKWAWQSWTANITFPSPGLWNVLARATDHTGAAQPLLVPNWNPGGYGNNQAMKVDVEVLPSLVLLEQDSATLPAAVQPVLEQDSFTQLNEGSEAADKARPLPAGLLALLALPFFLVGGVLTLSYMRRAALGLEPEAYMTLG